MKTANQPVHSVDLSDRSGAERPPPDRIGPWLVSGALIAVGMLGGIAAWAGTTAIDGAVVAPAQIVVETNRKTLQHLEGGIVREILVEDGDLVQAGDGLIRLDTTEDQAALVALDDRLADLAARQARLQAELIESDTIVWPETLGARTDEPRIAALMSVQEQLFRFRQTARNANAQLLTKRAVALQARIEGLTNQQTALRRELALTTEEDKLLTPLQDRNLVPLPRLIEIRRNIARLESRLAEDASESVSLTAQIEEIWSERGQSEAQFRERAAAELIEVQGEIAKLEEQQAALRDRLRRREIRAPQTGRVFNLAIHTVGAVVASGEELMEIVPLDDDLILRARIPAAEVERVSTGLAATVRLTSFNRNTTPELTGTIETVSADANIDGESNDAFYSATVRLGPDQLARLDGQTLTPGMPAEVLILTGERLVASYITRPLADTYARAFRDE